MNRQQISGNDIGAVLVASPYDWLFAKGCLASLHWFMPELPVTLLIDGKMDTSVAERTYGLTVIRKEDVPDPWLRQNSFGWGITKMTAVWHAPYKRFLYLDADTVLWGNLHAKIFGDETDIVWSVPKSFEDELLDYTDKWYFDPAGVKERWPDFDWEKHIRLFACTGTFMLRRGCLKIERYRELVEAGRNHPHLFKFGEMGILNMMVFEAVQAGALQFKQSEFQVIFPDFQQEALRKRFDFDGQGCPIVNPGDEQVLHMPDKKPLMNNAACYGKPMTFFRLKYLENTAGLTGSAAVAHLQQEDEMYHRLRVQFLRREKWKKILGLTRGSPGEWRRLLKRLKT